MVKSSTSVTLCCLPLRVMTAKRRSSSATGYSVRGCGSKVNGCRTVVATDSAEIEEAAALDDEKAAVARLGRLLGVRQKRGTLRCMRVCEITR